MSGSGRSGVTHCGKWTSNVPSEEWIATRIVCSHLPGHTGPHVSPDGWTWTGAEKPKRQEGRP